MKVQIPDSPFEPDHVVFTGELSEFSEMYSSASKYGQLLVDFRFAKRYYVIAFGNKIHVIPTNDDSTIIEYYEQLSEFDNKHSY